MKFQALIPKRSLFTGRKDDQDYQLDSDYDDYDLTNNDANHALVVIMMNVLLLARQVLCSHNSLRSIQWIQSIHSVTQHFAEQLDCSF